MYGHRWTAQFVDEGQDLAMAAWMEALADVSDESMKGALNQCIASGEAWPPSLPEFRKLCVGSMASDFERAQRARMAPTATAAYLDHKPDPGDGSGLREFRAALDKLRGKMTTKEAGGEA